MNAVFHNHSTRVAQVKHQWSVRDAEAHDLDACFALEQSLSESNPNAVEHGFLLSGDTRQSYDIYLKSGPFLIAEEGDRVVGYLFALAPESDRLQKLRGMRERFVISTPDVFDEPKLSWLAKVAVAPDVMGQGVATGLYEQLLARHPDWTFMTTTVAAPVRNVRSELLQRKFGFAPVGEMPLGDRGALKNVICTVHVREPDVSSEAQR